MVIRRVTILILLAMSNESRVKKTLLNARVNLFFYFITLVLSFYSRKIFLDSLGDDFVGLIGTLTYLLSILNLAELGISTAIGYVLYKPIFEHNQHKINEIISVLGYLYNCIGKIILISGVTLSFFLPLIFPSTGFDLSIIYFAYYSFLCSSLIGYFINYRQTLLVADQKNYVITAYYQTANIVKIIIQITSACYTGSYYIWIAIELIFGIVYSYILNWKTNKEYPWLKSEVKNGKSLYKNYPEIMKYAKQLFIHKIGGLIQFQTTPFLIYAFVSLQTVTLYGNYSIITEKVKQLFDNFLGSTAAGIGNLIAEGNKEIILKVYWEMMALRFLVAGTASFSLYYILPQFINLWLGSEYILPDSILISVLVIFSLNILRGTTDQFINGYGLFHDIWSPAIECVIFLVVALVGGTLLQLEGILLGNIISLSLIIFGWKPFLLFKNGFKISVWIYWIEYIKLLLLTILSFIIFKSLMQLFMPKMNDLEWVAFFGFSLCVCSSLFIIQFVVLYFGSRGLRSLVKRIEFKCFFNKLKR